MSNVAFVEAAINNCSFEFTPTPSITWDVTGLIPNPPRSRIPKRQPFYITRLSPSGDIAELTRQRADSIVNTTLYHMNRVIGLYASAGAVMLQYTPDEFLCKLATGVYITSSLVKGFDFQIVVAAYMIVP